MEIEKKHQNIGIFGLGKIGKNITLNLINKKYNLILYNRSKGKYKGFRDIAICSKSVGEFAFLLGKRKKKEKTIPIIIMAISPDEPTNNALKELSGLLARGSIIIDLSNSFYQNSIKNYEILKKKGIHLLDAGCSGGRVEALNGKMAMIVAGDKESFAKTEFLLRDLCSENYTFINGSGAGHFAKIVNSAIEYGMMQSIGEGLKMLKEGPYKNVNIGKICTIWSENSIIRGHLLGLAAEALKKDPNLSNTKSFVPDSGIVRYAIKTANAYSIPISAITTSVYERFNSRKKTKFSNKTVAALLRELRDEV